MKHVLERFFLCCLLLSLSFCLVAEEKTRVAVMPFDAGQGVSKPEAKYLTERVRTGLIDTGIFDVISNDQHTTNLDEYWSKTARSVNTTYKFDVDFKGGTVTWNAEGTEHVFRCVAPNLP